MFANLKNIFFCLSFRFPSLPWDFTVLHKEPAVPQDHCGRCRIQTGDLCPRSLGRHQWATTSPTNEPPHLQQWVTTSPAMSHHISSNEPPHLHQWVTTSPAMSQHISSNEPPHLHQLSIPHLISPITFKTYCPVNPCSHYCTVQYCENTNCRNRTPLNSLAIPCSCLQGH